MKYNFTRLTYQMILVPPMVWIPNQLIGAQEGERVTLECGSEAHPKSINYWTRDKDEIVPQGKII